MDKIKTTHVGSLPRSNELSELLFKKDKNRLTAIFDYKNEKLIFKHANLRNFFLDGKLDGEVEFLPYFNFNLDVDLNTVNFNRLYNSLVTLDDEIKNKIKKYA